ncbi:hypothetical protein QAD02_009678 [Eretmocerus hayati]|uniref:Uncharacterized protein n=1 Tax=Eretmocerus hayati TaxID=131215 RepID=A0ACC2NA46_9HYME|nr:hypothetical protein QAD02_009678 [Eretmocerus hayati]
MYLVFVLITVIFLLIYFSLTQGYDYWTRQNVPSLSGALPGIGHALPLLLVCENIGMWAERLHRLAGNRSMYGCFFLRKPCLLVREPRLVKQVLQENFSSFHNNITSVNEKLDKVMIKNPFFAKDDEWRQGRQLLSTNFSSKTLRCVFESSLLSCCDQLVSYVKSKVIKYKTMELEMRDLATRLTGEFVANAAFGIQGHSFEENPGEMSFINVSRKLFETTTLNGLERIVRFGLPGLAQLLGLQLIPKETDLYFRNIVRSVLNSRLEQGDKARRADFLQFIIDRMDEIDEDTAVAQVTSLFFDGYETSGSVISSVLYRLADNPEVQDRARKEVMSVLEKYDNKLTYDAIKNMDYLEKVMLESLRLNPGLTEFTKICTQEVKLNGSDGLTCKLRPGDIVVVSAVGMHLDEEFWDRPDIFQPDRFDETDVTNDERHKFAFLPFGEGPRKCVGIRLATMMVKSVMAVLLRSFKMVTSPRTRLPLKMNPNSFSWVADGGLWVRFELLQNGNSE